MMDTIINTAAVILWLHGFSDILTTAFKTVIVLWSIGILLVLPASIRALWSMRRKR